MTITDVYEPRYSKRDVIIARNKVVNGLNKIKFSRINEQSARFYGGLSDSDIEKLKNETFYFIVDDINKLERFVNNGKVCVLIPLTELEIYKEKKEIEETKDIPKEEVKEEIENKEISIVPNIENLSGIELVILNKKEYLKLK